MQAKLDTQKNMNSTAPRIRTDKKFNLLKLLNHYDSVTGDIGIF